MRARAAHLCFCAKTLGVNRERSEVRGKFSVLDARSPVGQGEICFLIFFIIIRPVFLCTRIYLISISSPDLRQQKRNRLESQNHPATPPRPMVGHIIRMSFFFPRILKTSLHVADRFKFFHQPGGHYNYRKVPPVPCYISVMHLHDYSPSVFTVSIQLFSSYDRNVFCCQRDPFLDVQRPPSEPAF